MRRLAALVLLARRHVPTAAARGAPAALGPCERAALATALALADAAGPATVTVLAAGAAHHDEALEAALAAGADAAVRLDDALLERVDYQGLALALAAAARTLGGRLLLTGDRSADDARGAVGPAVAEHLGVPHVSGVSAVRLDQGAALAWRVADGLVRTLRVPLPALLAVTAGPPLAAAPARRPGAASPRLLRLADVGLSAVELRHRDRLLGEAAPAERTTPTLLSDGRSLAARLRADGLLR